MEQKWNSLLGKWKEKEESYVYGGEWSGTVSETILYCIGRKLESFVVDCATISMG